MTYQGYKEFDVPNSSPNFRTELADKLAELAPEIIADGKLDINKLAGLLNKDADSSPERFGLSWPGKREAQHLAQMPTTATLLPDRDNSVDWETTQNVFIEGDNLEVLKVLQKHYYGKIKMIYIDPPYNTGKDFVYKDDFRDGVANYLEWTEQTTDGGKLFSNTETAGRYHSNWLSMMYPRLKLARNLLSDEGVIFLSIGDKEQAHLKDLCDEIFGEQNFIANFIWEKSQHFGRQKINSYSNYDHIICYAKNLYNPGGNKKELLIEFSKDDFEDAPLYNSSNPEKTLLFRAGSTKFNIPDGVYSETSDKKYVLCNPVTVKQGWNDNDFELKFRSRWARETAIEESLKGTKFWVKSKNFAIRAIYAEGKTSNESPRQVIFTNSSSPNKTLSRFGIPVGTNEEASSSLNKLMGGDFFSYPKPSTLVEYLISLVEPGIVLDFFAGSGTTAEAVMAVNAKDGNNRLCISVQLPEPLESDKIDAHAAGFSTISEITRERIRRAGKKILKDETAKLNGRAETLDVGFRAYKLADTNFAKWKINATIDENELENLFNSVRDSANDASSPEELFTETILKLGLSLTEQYKQKELAGLTVFSVDHDLILGYFDEKTKPSLDQLRELVELAEVRLIVLEDAFQGDDELKTNLVQLCKTRDIDLSIA